MDALAASAAGGMAHSDEVSVWRRLHTANLTPIAAESYQQRIEHQAYCSCLALHVVASERRRGCISRDLDQGICATGKAHRLAVNRGAGSALVT